jgi:DNA-directed RNA polymerase specialized sigma24 family protein
MSIPDTNTNRADTTNSDLPAYMPTPTRWSVLEQAQQGSQAALDEFFRIYWPPVYAYFRAKGLQEADAKDRTQGFFLRWLESNTFASLDQNRGSFSRYLLTCLKHYHINEFIKGNRQRNRPAGGLVSWDEMVERDSARYEPAANQTPDMAFEIAGKRRLIMAVCQKVREAGSGGAVAHKASCDLFYRRYVEPMLDDGPQPSLEVLAQEFGYTVKQVRGRLDSLREEFRHELVAELAPEGISRLEAEQRAREILMPYDG